MNKFFLSIEHAVIITYLKMLKNHEQKVYVGKDSVFNLIKEMKKNKHSNALVVTSQNLIDLGLTTPLFDMLKNNNIKYSVYAGINNEPNIANVEEGFTCYVNNKCDSLIAIGGGSVLDCAKVIGARVSTPRRSVLKLKRLVGGITKFNIPFYAIPTTSGTGSENTLYALITNDETKEKYPILSNKYIPNYVALDPTLTVNLPLTITSYTGIDALTHAIESYVSTYSKYFKSDKKQGLEAIKLIFDNLEKVYNNPTNLKYRENMAIASYKAGLAFRKISIGYVHNFAHRMGELYHIPHGLAIAIILPYILEFMLPKASKSLSEIAIYCKLGTSDEKEIDLAQKVIEKVKQINNALNIPLHIVQIKEEDYPLLVKRIFKEANACGNPKVMSKKECVAMLDLIKGKKNEK